MDCDEANSICENQKIFAFEVDGRTFDIAVNNFNDRLFIIITEFGNIGTFISAQRSVSISGAEEDSREIYELKTLFGDDRLEYHVIARTLAESIAIDKPILFGLALKDLTNSIIETIRRALLENKIW